MQMNEALRIPPSRDLWGEPDQNDWDLLYAMELFLDKTNEEIIPMLERNYFMLCLELRVMPDPVFQYYGKVFADFLFRDDLDENDFGVYLGCFLDVSADRLKFWRAESGLLEKMSERLASSNMIDEIKTERIEELNQIRAKVRMT